MKELESPTKAKSPAPKTTLSPSRPPTLEQLRGMTTDELVKLLMSSEMAQPANEHLRQQIIKILQEREGNAFVQRLLGEPR